MLPHLIAVALWAAELRLVVRVQSLHFFQEFLRQMHQQEEDQVEEQLWEEEEEERIVLLEVGV